MVRTCLPADGRTDPSGAGTININTESCTPGDTSVYFGRRHSRRDSDRTHAKKAHGNGMPVIGR